MSNPLNLSVPEGLPFIDYDREFDFPVADVFRAHKDPNLITQWLGPRGYKMDIDHYDFRTGGSYSYLHTGPEERIRHPDLRIRGLPGYCQPRIHDL